ncbi:MAG: hypothetical protein GDA52_03850 [Rhodobacteraceae bacterium]|nr:hypothetical protein [Paracoccaceae bacterium]
MPFLDKILPLHARIGDTTCMQIARLRHFPAEVPFFLFPQSLKHNQPGHWNIFLFQHAAHVAHHADADVCSAGIRAV